MPINAYTRRWFELFLHPLEPAQTAREADFLRRMLSPRERFPRVVDVCSGPGRHAHALATAGYAVTGVDRDASAVAEAQALALPHEAYRAHDMRDLPSLGLQADAVLCLWQSFGFFDAATNRRVLGDFAAILPAGGRCLVDLYHREFFVANQGTRTMDLRGRLITESKRVAGDRLSVTLLEGDGVPVDAFEWQLYTPQEFVMLGESVGLGCRLVCTDYDETHAAHADLPRVQYVFEKS